MAIYTHNTTATVIDWYNTPISHIPLTPPTSSLVILSNSDGTETRLIGTGFVFSGNTPTAGSITEIDRTASGGGTVLETVTGLNLSLVTLLGLTDPSNRSAFALIFNGVDTFNGYAGNDLLVGGPGADAFVGGNGVDTVSYDNALSAVTASIGGPAANTGDAQGDTYSSIENLIGTDFNDVLFGGTADNMLSGGLGNDLLYGGGTSIVSGNDTLDGGAGSDTARYDLATITAGIVAVLSTTSSVTGDASVGTDTLISIEAVRGTNFVDDFTATLNFNGSNGLGNEFEGRGGNDTIHGNGSTRVSYQNALAGVTVDLLSGNGHSTVAGDAAGVGIDSFAGTVGPDNINAVNAIRGSAFADILSGAGARGFLQFAGLGGNDIFTGSTEAINNFDFNQARYDFGTTNGIAVVLDTTSQVTDLGGSSVGTDTLINIERVRGTSFHDTFTANAGFSGPYGTVNYFEGGGGDDTITGNGHTVIQYSNALAGVTVNLQTGSAHSTVLDTANVGLDTITGGVNNVLGSDFNDILIGSDGAGAESFSGDAGDDIIDGGGGLLDRVSYTSFGSTQGANVNLATGFATDGFGDTDTLSNIEGVVGTELGDIITGDDNVNRLVGQNGDDILNGAGGDDLLVGDDGVNIFASAFGTGGTAFDIGNDTLDGGTGADQMWGGKGNDTYVVDDLGDVVTENANEGTDLVQTALATYTLSNNVEKLTFIGVGAFSGFGNVLDNVITGGAGNDTVDGGPGTNSLNGGPGSDTVSYASAAAGITARLDLGFGQHSVDGLFDTYISIENVIGSGFGDTLVGLGGVANTLDGGNGDDFLYGEGIDNVIGGAGNDVFFGGQGSALNINLATSGVETVWGSFVGDVMDGSTASANLTMVGQGLTGGANADTMMGGSGDDFIYYRAGDVITGGSGNDWAVATLSSTGVTLNMTTTGFENAWGSTSDDTITAAGSATTVVMVGDTGNDTLTGGNAGDFLYGFSGNDTLTGGGGNDNLIGGADTDTFVFGANWGTDIVWDWQDGSEQFNMQGSGAANFAALAVNQNFSGSGNALISFGANQILVVGGANHIDAGDFIF